MVSIVIAFATVTGLIGVRWAKSYAGSINGGATADWQTLCSSLLHVEHNNFIFFRDTLWALGLALFNAGFLLIGLNPNLLVLCNALFMLALFDFYSGLLPDAVVLPLMWLGWAFGPLGLAEASSASALMASLLYLAAGLYVILRNRNGFGGGDIKLLAAIAAWLGLDATLMVLLLASVSAVLFIIVIRGKLGQSFVFGPFLAIATMVQMLI